MRVVMISHDPGLLERGRFGELQTRVLAYASHLGHLDILVRAADGRSRSPFDLNPKLTIHPIAARTLPAFVAGTISNAARLHGRSGVDVVSSQDPFGAGIAGAVLKRWKRLPLNIQIHSDQIDNPYFHREGVLHRGYSAIAKRVLRQADTVRVVCRRAMAVCERIGIPSKRCWYLPLVFGLDPFFTARELGLRNQMASGRSKTMRLILFVGRFSREKGWDVALDTAARILREREESRLVMVGQGKEEPAARRTASRLAIDDRVTFSGWLPSADLPRYYAAADVCIVPSRHEGFGRVILEAQAAARAVVASETAGAVDLIRPGRTGVLVPIEHPHAMAQAVLDLLADDPGRSAMGRLASNEARRRWADYDLPREFTRMLERTRDIAA